MARDTGVSTTWIFAAFSISLCLGRNGYRLGLIGAPARITQAAAPLLFGVLIERWGSGVLYVSSRLCLFAFLSLAMVRPIPLESAASS